jgi:Family of unknown function (DUF6174)
MRRSRWLLPLASTIAFVLFLMALTGGGDEVLSNCGSSPRMDLAVTQRRLDAARVLWRQHWRPDYALTIQTRGSWDHYNLELRVGRNAAARLTYVPIRGAGTPSPRVKHMGAEFIRYHTVSALFASIQEIVRRTPSAQPCGTLNVEFDSLDGYPRRIVWDSPYIIDEETDLTISSLSP